MLAYAIAIAGIWVVFLLYWFFSALGAKKNVGRADTWRGAMLRLAIAVVIFLMLRNGNVGSFIEDVDRALGIGSAAAGMIGVIICTAGVALAIWARRHLGRNWGMPMSLKEDPELVTSGPYTRIRHPIYTGFLLAMLGSALASSSAWLIVFFAFGAYFIYSAKKEEKIMEKEFPDKYPAYKSRTKMLIPFVL